MKLGTRIFSATAVALLLVPALFADDTPKPSNVPDKDRSANSATPTSSVATSKPPGKPLTPLPAANARQTPAGNGTGKTSEKHGRRSREQSSTTPKVELFLGYSYWSAVPESTGNRIDAMHGGSTSLAYNLNNHVGLVFDFGGFRVDSLQFTNTGPAFTPSRVVDADGSVFTFLFGPRVSFRDHGRFTPFLQVLGGAAHAGEVTLDGCNVAILACQPLPSETAFALTAGGGLDYRLSHRFALRLFQAEYLLTHFQDPSSLAGDSGWQSNVRLSAGLVLRFGGNPPPPPNHPPMASCSMDKSMVYAGSGDTAGVHASASDPDNDSGRGGVADCQLGIEVREPQPPPEMVELETRLALHSIYFPSARPSIANPNGGLVGSQEKILVALAEDFKRYLRFRPDAHLILGGHADHRGSQEYNKLLTERRVARTKSLLVAHGVSEAAIDTRAFGEDDNLTEEQVKEQIAQNPDITPDERQQMLNNLHVMVLANNRRVDVTLSTTGQQSTRRYPFNARDFLALINTTSGDKKKAHR